jgi:hypothetical protein
LKNLDQQPTLAEASAKAKQLANAERARLKSEAGEAKSSSASHQRKLTPVLDEISSSVSLSTDNNGMIGIVFDLIF